MKLVYRVSQREVRVGHKVAIGDDVYRINAIRKPPEPTGDGHVIVGPLFRTDGQKSISHEFNVSAIGAEWIEREDRR